MKLGDLDLLSFGHTIQMAGAIYQGEGKTFLCFFPEDKNDLPTEVLELSQADWEELVKQTDLLQTEVLTNSSDGKLAKVIVRKSQRQIEQGVSWAVWKRDSYACRYCSADSVPLTVDHLVCWEDGGPSIEANLLSACRKCNKVRGNLPYEDWLNHPHYLKVSQRLPPDVREANAALIHTLAGIPRKLHVSSR